MYSFTFDISFFNIHQPRTFIYRGERLLYNNINTTILCRTTTEMRYIVLGLEFLSPEAQKRSSYAGFWRQQSRLAAWHVGPLGEYGVELTSGDCG